MEHIVNYFKKREGVTLAELMVAFGVFGVFMAIALGGFMQSLQNQRVALAFMEANDAASILFEDVARELRTAKIATIQTQDRDGKTKLTFTDYKNKNLSYDFSGTQISSRIVVETFHALVVPSVTKGAPPRVVLSITMKITDPSIGDPARKVLQTTISPRVYYNLREIQI